MRRLQEFGFEKSGYERPNQKWICGRAHDGQCCLAGPDARGNCTATAECRPLRKGDHWHCTRPAFLGGPCAEGPLPDGQCCRPVPKCSPVRSLRSWRGVAVLLTVAVTLTVLLLTLGSWRGNAMLSPGELSFSHSSLGNNCSQCHGPIVERPSEWVAVTAASTAAHDNSGLCLNCHNVGQVPLQPHSLPEDRLRMLTKAVGGKGRDSNPPAGLMLASFVVGPVQHDGKGLACADCHKEHGGQEASLTKLSNDQCQNCHATQFASFADGHPPFSHYPFTRRTRLIFDHETHLHSHFKDAAVAKLAPASCLDCHQTDARGATMVVKPFEVVCASCHEDQIKGKAAVKTGVAFLGLPQMDDRALSGQYSIGQWPEDASQPLTPFLRLLLSADPPELKAVEDLRGVDLSNLPKTNAAKLKSAQTLAWGIKSLIFDLEMRGQDEVLKRVSLATGRQLTNHEKEGLVAFFNLQALRSAFQSAFPDLQKEVLDYRNGGKCAPTKLVPSPELAAPGPVKAVAPDAWVNQGGWYSPDGSFALFYHPRGHGDRFLSSWMDVSVDSGRTVDPADAQALFKDLSAPTAVGLCSKCHSVDDLPVKQVNWTGAQPDPLEHGFSRFSHTAHLSLLDTRGCLTCHPMNGTPSQSKDTYAAAFEPGQRDPARFRSNFRTIDKSVCANCHQPGHVREDCLMCHNYHIGRFKPVVAHAEILSRPSRGGGL